MSEQAPKVAYWHLWTGETGVSRQTRCWFTDFELTSFAPPASPQWVGAKTRDGASVWVTVLPPGWVGEWHENPRPQWIIPLSGSWFVESMDGQRVELGPGELSFGEDQHSREIDGRRGHLSGVVGQEPAVLMLVQFDTEGRRPRPVGSGETMDDFEFIDPRFRQFVLDNAPLEVLAEGFRWIEGLVWMGDAGCLLFQDLPRDRTMRWTEGVGVSVYRAPSRYANGQTRDRQGRLIACSHLDRCLYRTEVDGLVTRLVDRHDGRRLNAPNDLVVASDGAVWFTDPLYGISNDYEGRRQTSEQPPALYRFNPQSGDIRVMASDFGGPNGLAFSPDEQRLYVAETGDQSRPDPVQHIRVFDVEASPDGPRLSGGEVFHKISPGYCDGLCVDEEGFIWSSAADGVHCLSPDGELLGKVCVPFRVSNFCFGGPERNRMFIGGSRTLYAVFLNRRGAQWP